MTKDKNNIRADKDTLKQLRRDLLAFKETIESAIGADLITESVPEQVMQGELLNHLSQASHLIHSFWTMAKQDDTNKI